MRGRAVAVARLGRDEEKWAHGRELRAPGTRLTD